MTPCSNVMLPRRNWINALVGVKETKKNATYEASYKKKKRKKPSKVKTPHKNNNSDLGRSVIIGK